MGTGVRDRHAYRASSARRAVRFLFSNACYCLLLTFLCLPVLAQTGSWVRQPVGSLAWLHAGFFLDENHGWVVGSQGTLLATVDGGKSWQAKSRPTPDVLRDIYFTDDQNGWLLCEANIYELKGKKDPLAYLMQTSDGGENWKRISIKGVEVDARLVRTIFSKGGRGWVFGEEGA